SASTAAERTRRVTSALESQPGAAPSHADGVKEVRIAIVGSGFAGLGMAIALRRRGETDFVVLERAMEVGGTWRDNHYPGAACDVPSHLYSLSFEPKPDWSRMFAPQREIFDYLKHVADKYGLRPHIRFHTEATTATFDERTGIW